MLFVVGCKELFNEKERCYLELKSYCLGVMVKILELNKMGE